jgi:small-conductance mechanosensitive channel
LLGLGIGGIAVAFTARTFIEDAINALCMYIDQPFKIGETIQINDSATAKGSVVHIGLKSTRIRAKTGELLVFPNSMIAGARIQNFHQMDFRKGDISFVCAAYHNRSHVTSRLRGNKLIS